MSIIINYLPFLGKSGSWVPNTHYKFNTCNSKFGAKNASIKLGGTTCFNYALSTPSDFPLAWPFGTASQYQKCSRLGNEQRTNPSITFCRDFWWFHRYNKSTKLCEFDLRTTPTKQCFSRGSQLRLDHCKTEVDLGKDRRKKGTNLAD